MRISPLFNQGRSQEFDLGEYKSKAHTGHWHDIEFVLGQGDKTTTKDLG